MTAFHPRCMTSFEEKVTQCLDELGLSMPELAELVDMPELELTALCRHGDPPLSYVLRLAEALRIPTLYFLNGSFNQAGTGNVQKIKIGKAAAHELAAQLGVCRQALEQSQQLVEAKDETIALLRGSLSRPK